MAFAIGIYGYTFTKAFELRAKRFEPLYQDHRTACARGRNTEAFHLTGLLLTPANSLSELRASTAMFFDLEAALTFCEQQRVALSHSVQLMPGEDARTMLMSDKPNEVKNSLPLQLGVSNSLFRRGIRPTSGACLQFDAFAPETRIRFLELVTKKLADPDFQRETGFRSAFFRNTEIARMGEAPIDVIYSLVFTGLELLARKNLKSGSKKEKLSDLLEGFLSKLGFKPTVDEAGQIATCRNALFHRGEYDGTYWHSESKQKQSIKITDLPRIEVLFADVLLKVLGFDAPEINWNRWRDRMAFK